jgi:hypothetical protein
MCVRSRLSLTLTACKTHLKWSCYPTNRLLTSYYCLASDSTDTSIYNKSLFIYHSNLNKFKDKQKTIYVIK